MNFASLASSYALLNLLIAIGFLFLRFFLPADRSAKTSLRIHYTAIVAIIFFFVANPWIPKKPMFEPRAKVWAAPSLKNFSKSYSSSHSSGYLTFPMGKKVEINKVTAFFFFIFFGILIFGGFRLAYSFFQLYKIRKNSFIIRRFGNITIFASDQIAIPFSYWLPRSYDVVVPNSLLSRPLDYRMAVIHELQHHRQGDTHWVYILWSLKVFCFWNPFIYFWNHLISEIQEFACDETLVDQNKVESQQYARCLVEIAQQASRQKYVPVCATGLAFLAQRHLLKRRIKQMISTSKKANRWYSFLCGGILIALMAVTAVASQELVQDRRVTFSEAQQLAENGVTSEFPVVINDLVLKQLNRYIGTPEGREYMRNALERMEAYRAIIEKKIKYYHVPSELMAIPIVESGYKNRPAPIKSRHGAGLWMFVESTANIFGLKTEKGGEDERLNVELSTDAALRYLLANKLRFRDWQLAMLAYNIGEGKVSNGIKNTGSKDAWTLVRNGFENDKDYLPSVMAAILIMRNPKSVE